MLDGEQSFDLIISSGDISMVSKNETVKQYVQKSQAPGVCLYVWSTYFCELHALPSAAEDVLETVIMFRMYKLLPACVLAEYDRR